MKISKLFHWLYAFLMFLPVFALIPTTFYFAFNEHAQDYTNQTITTTYEYETNEVNSASDIVIGNIYKLDYYYDGLEFNRILTLSYARIYSEDYGGFLSFTNVDLSYDGSDFFIYCRPDGYSFGFQYGYIVLTDNDYTSIDLSNLSLVLNISDYLGEATTTINTDEMNPLTAFENAFNTMVDFPLFSWAQTSFLSAPMVYITGLFGMPSNSPVITLLSYWLSISIVWLVFDLVMYIPLLVHRWIDRGIIE